MNLIEFNKILKEPGDIQKEETRGLEQILQEYPYFQAARFLHLYGLKKQHSFKYNDALKKTAAFTNDRALLFDYITSFDFEFHAAPPRRSAIEPEQAKDEPEMVSEVEKDTVEEIESNTKKTPEETLGIGKPLNFDKSESYSFNEWLQLSQFKPLESEEQDRTQAVEQDPVPKSKSKMELIDDFIASQPRINTSYSETYEDISLNSSTENEQLMTETLAHVYVEQKKYEKAITAFTILSLKYPEKSSFFADQIQAIRELQNK